MPPIVSSSRSLARLLSSRRQARRLPATLPPIGSRSERVTQSRCSSTFASFSRPCLSQLINPGPSVRALHGGVQKRGFLGCGDGEEGSVLFKTYEERRVMGYSPEQLYSVVAAVDLYEDFVPWCQRSKIIRRNADGSIDAELQIGFKFLVESYISHVELEKPKRIKVASMFFKEVVSRLVGSFSDRCSRIYGPAIRVLENSYGQAR